MQQAVPLLQFFVSLSVVSCVAFVLSLVFLIYPSFGASGRVALRGCGIFYVSLSFLQMAPSFTEDGAQRVKVMLFSHHVMNHRR